MYWQEVVDSVSYTTESCKMVFSISYLVYNVNYFECLLIAYFVYSKKYHVCLLITTRTNQIGEFNRWTTASRQIYGQKQNPLPSGSGSLWTIDPCLLCTYRWLQLLWCYPTCHHRLTVSTEVPLLNLVLHSWNAFSRSSLRIIRTVYTGTAVNGTCVNRCSLNEAA